MLLFTAALSSGYAGSPDARKLLEQGKVLPLEIIIVESRKYKDGRILEVELEKHRQKLVYEIELITKDGIVWELYFDAETGQLLKSKQDD